MKTKNSSIRLIIIVLVLLLSSCIKDKNTIPKSAEKYAHLVAKDEASLSYEELYNRALTLWKTEFTELNVTTRAGTASIIVSGSEQSPPILLLHGMNASSTMWHPNIEALSKHHRVYAIDFILGPGKSKLTGELSSKEDIAKWYIEVADQLSLQKFGIVAASQGGWIATNIALRYPKKVTHLALLSPANTFTWLPISKDLFSNILFTLNPKREKLRDILKTMTTNVDAIDQLYIDQYYRATKNAAFSEIGTKMTPLDEDELASLNMPVLLMIGDKDIVNDKDTISVGEKHIPNIRSYVVENAGHFLSIDQHDFVNKKVIEFLSRDL